MIEERSLAQDEMTANAILEVVAELANRDGAEMAWLLILALIKLHITTRKAGTTYEDLINILTKEIRELDSIAIYPHLNS